MDILTKLIERGANIEAKDDYYRTPLIVAVQNGHESIVELLVGISRENLNALDKDLKTALFWSIEKGGFSMVLEKNTNTLQ